VINLYSLNATTNAMRLAKQYNMNIAADDESIVGLMNKATNTRTVYDSAITDEQFYQDLPKVTALVKPSSGTGEESVVIDTAAGADVLSVDDHEKTLQQLKGIAVSRVDGLLDFARNVVQPFVSEVVKNATMAPVEETKEDWALEPVGLDPAFDEPVVKALIDSVANKTGNGFVHEAYQVSIPDDLQVPVTGSKAFDDLLGRLLNDAGISLRDALEMMLAETVISPAADNAPVAARGKILSLLLSSYYAENPWADSGLSSNAWENVFNRIFYTSVGWLYMFAQNIVERTEGGQVVYSYDYAQKRVYVCQEAFDAYIDKGGCPEALYGALYLLDDGAKGVSLNANQLIANNEKYVAAWERRGVISRMNEDTDWLAKNRQALKQAFNVALGTGDKETYGHDLQGNLMSVQEITLAVNSRIDFLFHRDTTDLTRFIIETAGQEVFGEHNVTSLLVAIHDGMLEKRQPDEVATEWTINYVTDWLLQGVTVDASHA